MSSFHELIQCHKKNFVFLGEAGSGKSEIAINFAIGLAQNSKKKIHFFDMDMTKPLFRSRDISDELIKFGIEFHHEEQYMDAPTLVGGVNFFLKDKNSIVVMDVGGDYIGARSLGGFAINLNKEDAVIYYVLNALRPWSYDIEHIDSTLAQILNVSHINLSQLKFIDNTNSGVTTTSKDYIEGNSEMISTVTPYISIEFSCIKEDLYSTVKDKVKTPLVPIHLYLTYEWI